MYFFENWQQNLLSGLNSRWLLKPESGIVIRNAQVNDLGTYMCVGTRNNATDKKMFRIYVEGIFKRA